MRVASKTIDDGLVLELGAQIVFKPWSLKQLFGNGMDGDRFAVHVGEVSKASLHHSKVSVQTLCHQLLREHQGHAICRKSQR